MNDAVASSVSFCNVQPPRLLVKKCEEPARAQKRIEEECCMDMHSYRVNDVHCWLCLAQEKRGVSISSCARLLGSSSAR